MRIFPYSAINFLIFETASSLLTSKDGHLSGPMRFLSGSMAGLTSVAFTYPLDLVRTRLAASTEGGVRWNGGIRGVLAPLVKESKSPSQFLRVVYRGAGPTLVGIVPYAGLNFYIFGTLRALVHARGDRFRSPFTNVICGAVAGAISQTVTYPLDVVRRRLQLEGADGVQGEGVKKARTGGRWPAWTLFKEILQREGARALYRGISLNFYRVIPSVGVSFMTFEFLKENT